MSDFAADIGEKNFSSSDNCVGHGDPSLSLRWAEKLTDHRGAFAPEGFVFIKDAELTAVALVPVEMAESFIALLNGAP